MWSVADVGVLGREAKGLIGAGRGEGGVTVPEVFDAGPGVES